MDIFIVTDCLVVYDKPTIRKSNRRMRVKKKKGKSLEFITRKIEYWM